jgi:mercuric ion transport protein
MERERVLEIKRAPLWAAGAILGALAASTCCALPLLLVSVGISGAWIGTLTRLAPYQPVFVGLAAVCIAGGFWPIYGRDRPVCANQDCGMPVPRWATKTALWLGTAIVLVAASAEWWGYLLA